MGLFLDKTSAMTYPSGRWRSQPSRFSSRRSPILHHFLATTVGFTDHFSRPKSNGISTYGLPIDLRVTEPGCIVCKYSWSRGHVVFAPATPYRSYAAVRTPPKVLHQFIEVVLTIILSTRGWTWKSLPVLPSPRSTR